MLVPGTATNTIESRRNQIVRRVCFRRTVCIQNILYAELGRVDFVGLLISLPGAARLKDGTHTFIYEFVHIVYCATAAAARRDVHALRGPRQRKAMYINKRANAHTNTHKYNNPAVHTLWRY